MGRKAEVAGRLLLSIETSCDETSAAVVADGRRILSNIIRSQDEVHAAFGGVVPELAARGHLEAIAAVVQAALEVASVGIGDLDAIAVTRGPGLLGCLLVGVGFAAGLGRTSGLVVVPVNHLHGHVYATFLESPSLEPPLLAMVVSGAHTDLVQMKSDHRFEILGRTRDDAAGEAFDKAARLLGLGYPGGAALDRLARQGQIGAQPLPKPMLPDLEFSFSGLKTALLYRLRDLGLDLRQSPPQPGTEQWRTAADLAAAFEWAVTESLVDKIEMALRRTGIERLVIAGGVAANTRLRWLAAQRLGDKAEIHIPTLRLCTDNAAMIGAAAHFQPPGDSAWVGADAALNW